MYVANSGSDRRPDTISVIDGKTNEVIKNIAVDNRPTGLEFNTLTGFNIFSILN